MSQRSKIRYNNGGDELSYIREWATNAFALVAKRMGIRYQGHLLVDGLAFAQMVSNGDEYDAGDLIVTIFICSD